MQVERPNVMTRNTFLRTVGVGIAGSAALTAAGCGSTNVHHAGSGWKQYSGMTLNFISENTGPSSAIAANLQPFTELTGINVNISQLVLTSVEQKVALDLSAHSGQYQVIYADPYNIMAPLSHGFADLTPFLHDKTLPSVPKGVGDFVPTQLLAAGRFGDKLLALPYDCPTIIWCYRKDLFQKHRAAMQHDLGFDPTPSIKTTWDQYLQIAKWFNANQSDVPYGTGHQAKQFTSLNDDFANVLWAYGGDYFNNGKHIGMYGSADPGPCTLDQPSAIRAAEFYKKLIDAAHPGSVSWDWNDLAEAFGDGLVAMCPCWHEDAAGWFKPGGLGDKVGFAPLPTGPVRSANHFGGTGIAINRYISKDEQRAAWLFLVWATSPQTQQAGLFSKVGGGTPTRQSVYQMPKVQRATKPPSDAPNMIPYNAVKVAWEPQNIGLRPKVPYWNQCDAVIFTELSKMLAGHKSPADAMRAAKHGVDAAVKGKSSGV
ncbi:MAG: extracellular solute-binding protein [Mycobacterium sp.]|nr:extracellular solute-binding protein [Mycobacterium sp.]